MVLPGWQEELTRLRQERQIISAPLEAEWQFIPEAEDWSTAPDYFQQSAEREAPDLFNQEQEPDLAERAQAEPLPDLHMRFSERASRELQAKMRELEAAIQPQSSLADELPEPASAVEQPPSSAQALKAEEHDADVTELDTVTWQAPETSQPDLPVVKNDAPQEDQTVRVVEGSVEADLEDQPTLSLNVPFFVQGRLDLPIERASTPQPGNTRPFVEGRSEMENQPTMPMRLPLRGARSPLPSVAQMPQPLPNFVDLPRLEDRPMSQGSNQPSSPGDYEQRIPGPGQFGPGERPSGPPSQPGMQPSWNETQPTWQGTGPVSRPGQPAFPGQLPDTPRLQPLAPPTRQAPQNGRRRLLLVTLLILLLLLGGTGGFVVYVQNQSAASTQAVQPTQSYQNTSLGFSLSYPQGWTASFDRAQSAVHFADSTATVQVNLARANVGSSTLDRYLSQQATQLGVTNQRAAGSVSFAGTNWQALQGNVLQGGATYMITLYVAQHNSFFYTLSCLTIPNVYVQAERMTFAALRQSFQFL